MKIIFYSTHCPKCKVLEAKMKKAGLTYTEVDDVDEMMRLGLKSAPYLNVDGVLLDFAAANKFLKGVDNGVN